MPMKRKSILVTGGEGPLSQQVRRGILLSDAAHQIWQVSSSAKLNTSGILSGDQRWPHLGLSAKDADHLRSEVEIIIHLTCETSIRESLTQQRLCEVVPTHHAVAFARTCPRLERFLFLSSTQVFGEMIGRVRETPDLSLPNFTNAREKAKWEAEQLVVNAWLPCEVVRIAPLIEHSPWLHWLGWLWQGHLPVVPGDPDSRIDFATQESIGLTVARLLQLEPQLDRVVHLCQGDSAPSVNTFLEMLQRVFSGLGSQHASPTVVDAEGFNRYHRAVMQSQHPLFGRILDHASYFLPSLLYPKVFENSVLQTLVPTLELDWVVQLERVATEVAHCHVKPGTVEWNYAG